MTVNIGRLDKPPTMQEIRDVSSVRQALPDELYENIETVFNGNESTEFYLGMFKALQLSAFYIMCGQQFYIGLLTAHIADILERRE